MLRVMFEPLLDGFISYQEPEPSRFIGINCSLHIEIAKRHNVRHKLGSAIFGRDEVELIVDAPVVRHDIRSAVLKN